MNKIRRRCLRLTGVVASAATALVGASLFAPAAAAADIGGSFASTTNASDPFVMRCTDEGVQGLCMYTSQDMGITANLPPDNPYPMQNTRGFFSSDGGRTWIDRGYVFAEDQIPWVPANPNNPRQKALHLWAPAAWQDPATGFTYLYVPDVSNASLPAQNDPLGPNVHTSSRIAVAFGFSPFGPFGYLSSVADQNGNVPGYMSDPEPFSDSTGRYLLWANGDGDTCGGLSDGVRDIQ